MRKSTASIFSLTFLVAICWLSCQPKNDFPDTRVQTVVDEYHGVKVEDPYRWLEKDESEEVQAWTSSQNQYARSHLDTLPKADAIRSELKQIYGTEATANYYSLCSVGSKLLGMKLQPPKQQPLLVVLEDPQNLSTEKVLLDPEVLDPTLSTTIDWYRPSPDGELVAISLSKSGSEVGDVHIFDISTAESADEVVPRVNGGTALGDLAWALDSKSFFYTRYPRGQERAEADMSFFVQIYHHVLGQPTGDDTYVLGGSFPRIAEIRLQMHPDNGRLLATVQKGDGGEFEIQLREPTGEWIKISSFDDSVVEAVFGPQDSLYLLSYDAAPRGKILEISSITEYPESRRILIPESEAALESSFYNWYSPTFWATENLLYLIYQVGGPSELKVFDLEGNPMPSPEQLPVSAISSLTPLTGDDVLFANQSYIDVKKWFEFRPSVGTTRETAMSTRAPVDFSDVKVEREMAISKDGTQVPVNIVMPKTVKLDGTHPIVVTGYGGYGISMTPSAVIRVRPLLDRGILFAETNLRGGGEFGREWHEQGRLTNKQNVFDDFKAALRHLVDRGYTSPGRIAIMGASNGGLLMGAVLTQDHELIEAVVSWVGIYDMLRTELSPNGEFNIPESGTVQDPAQFEALYAYSPYHNVREGFAYPATLLITGANDPRVEPMQSRKMTARLQAAQAGDALILLRTDPNTGHGAGTQLDDAIEELTDAFAFILENIN